MCGKKSSELCCSMTALTLNGLSETHVVGQHAPSDLFVQMYIRPHKLNAFDLMGEQLAVNILIDLEAIFELLKFKLYFLYCFSGSSKVSDNSLTLNPSSGTGVVSLSSASDESSSSSRS